MDLLDANMADDPPVVTESGSPEFRSQHFPCREIYHFHIVNKR